MAKQTSEGGVIMKLESGLEEFFLKKLPGLPANIKEIIVKFSPWIALVVLIISIPTLLAALGLSAIFAPMYWGYRMHFGYNFAWWISIAGMVLMVLALPGLFKRKLSAWKLMFYSSLLTAVYSLITLSLGSLIIGTGISWYILFQIKSYYK